MDWDKYETLEIPISFVTGDLLANEVFPQPVVIYAFHFRSDSAFVTIPIFVLPDTKVSLMTRLTG